MACTARTPRKPTSAKSKSPLDHSCKRGPADAVDPESEAELVADLKGYCQVTEKLWDFGQYNDGAVDRHKQPILTSLLLNAPLWKILLKYFRNAKMTDSIFIRVMQDVLKDKPDINTMKCDNELFCMWLSKRIHVQMGHLHDCKNYPQKVKHRMAMMDPDQVKRFEDLMACVSTSKEPDMRSPKCMRTKPPSPACIATAGIPMMFAGPTSSSAAVQHEPPSSSTTIIPSMFQTKDAIQMDARALRVKAEATPPLPSKRGGIRAACEGTKPKDSDGFRVSITTAKTGNKRTYVLVNNKSWGTVTEKRHVEHKAIMETCMGLLRENKWDREQSTVALNQLIGSWPNIPDLSHV